MKVEIAVTIVLVTLGSLAMMSSYMGWRSYLRAKQEELDSQEVEETVAKEGSTESIENLLHIDTLAITWLIGLIMKKQKDPNPKQEALRNFIDKINYQDKDDSLTDKAFEEMIEVMDLGTLTPNVDFDRDRQDTNRLLAQLLIEAVEKNPSQRFGQILRNEGFVLDTGGFAWVNEFNAEPQIVLERVMKRKEDLNG